jgi:hypothetical protein
MGRIGFGAYHTTSTIQRGGSNGPDRLRRLSRHKHSEKGGWSWRDGREWPQRKKAAIKWQTGDPADQKKNRGTAIEYRPSQQKHRGVAIGDRAGLKKNCCAAIEDRAGQLTNCGTAIDFHAGQKKNRGAAINGLRRPKEKLQRGNRGIGLAYWKIAARQSVDCASHLKICGGGLATISKGGEGLRKGQIRIEHGALLKREASGSIIT